MKKVLGIMLVLIAAAGCTSTQITQAFDTVNKAMEQNAKPTDGEVGGGLKEALINGISKGAQNASKEDGYFKNEFIKILFPPEIKKVEEKLRKIGLGGEVDKMVLALNRGAEDAAKSAKPIFVAAIKDMSIEDVWGILRGEDDAATVYLKSKTSKELTNQFSPVMQQSLDKVNATKYYGDVMNTYNKIPFVEKVNPDLNAYATQKAIDGLFTLVAEQEKLIREDPVARTSDLLKKVFGWKGE